MTKASNSQSELAERVRGLIEEHDGGSVGKAAKRVGISQPSLHYIVRGQNWPSVETLAKIAAAYGVSADWLLGLSAERVGSGAGAAAIRADVARQLRALAAELERTPNGDGHAADDDESFPEADAGESVSAAVAREEATARPHRRKKAG